MQVGNGKVLLKELYSWVYTKDLVGYESNSNNTTNTNISNRKSNEEIANDIMFKSNYDGWGTGETRKQKLKAAGYDLKNESDKLRTLYLDMYSRIER